MPESQSTTIKISRPSGYVDRIRKYKIFVDGKQAGAISSGSTLEVAASPGNHIVEAKIDWCSSPALNVVTSPGEIAQVEVKNNWGVEYGLWAISFGRKTYLSLSRL